ncbi:hypothetical protein [Mycobacteroides abscessus]|uniref:hypothetical protein n=1 Tax=Mycobacteroides abscessus TaxID=36809 RepID=UPI002104012E|nr:hypothetical protein [Mycobacteroides abscessus]
MTRLDAAYLIGLGLRTLVAVPVAGYALTQIIPVCKAAVNGQFRWVPLAWLASITLLLKGVELPDRDWINMPLHGGWDLYYVAISAVLHPVVYVLVALLLMYCGLALRAGIGWLGRPASDPRWAPLTHRHILRRWWRVRCGEQRIGARLIGALPGDKGDSVQWDRDFHAGGVMSVFQIDAPDLNLGQLRAGIEKATENNKSIHSTVLSLEGADEPSFLIVNWKLNELDRPADICHLRIIGRRRIGTGAALPARLPTHTSTFSDVLSGRAPQIAKESY